MPKAKEVPVEEVEQKKSLLKRAWQKLESHPYATLVVLFLLISTGLSVQMFLQSRSIKTMRQEVAVHGAVLQKIMKGELPLIKIADDKFVPAIPFVLSQLQKAQQAQGPDTTLGGFTPFLVPSDSPSPVPAPSPETPATDINPEPTQTP